METIFSDATAGEDPIGNVFSADKIAQNTRVVYYCRTFLSIIAGCVAGILGVTGLKGFVCYLLMSLCVPFAIFARIGFQTGPFFRKPSDLFTGGIMDGMLSYVLFWTFLFDIVHIY